MCRAQTSAARRTRVHQLVTGRQLPAAVRCSHLRLSIRKRFPSGALSGSVVKARGVQKQIDGSLLPPQAHLTFALNDLEIPDAALHTGGQAFEHGRTVLWTNEDIEVDIDGAARALRTPRERECASERMWQRSALERLVQRRSLQLVRSSALELRKCQLLRGARRKLGGQFQDGFEFLPALQTVAVTNAARPAAVDRKTAGAEYSQKRLDGRRFLTLLVRQ